MQVNIDQTEAIINQLKSLATDKKPAWGLMTPQHMVEHLIVSTKMSNGGFVIPCRTPEDQIEEKKKFLIYSDAEMPKGIKAGGMEGLLDLRYPSMEAALEKLEDEINKFHQYFQENPGATIENPVVSHLNYDEWKIFHNKHYTHHFKQFELI